jgi:hypothetical protein
MANKSCSLLSLKIKHMRFVEQGAQQHEGPSKESGQGGVWLSPLLVSVPFSLSLSLSPSGFSFPEISGQAGISGFSFPGVANFCGTPSTQSPMATPPSARPAPHHPTTPHPIAPHPNNYNNNNDNDNNNNDNDNDKHTNIDHNNDNNPHQTQQQSTSMPKC